jgi:hypothetical protein
MDSRDARARREVADQVKRAVIAGSFAPVMAAHVGEPEQAAALTLESATAASAVVLASDLRAPAETRQQFIDRLIEDAKAGRVKMVYADESPFRVPSGGVSPNRQGWRARLANVERWLADVAESIAISTNGEESVPDWSRLRTGVDVALAEVRAMIDGAD